MLLSARGRIPTHAERTLPAYTISKVTWRDGAPCFRGHGASVAASRGKSSCFPAVTSARGTATVPRKSSPVRKLLEIEMGVREQRFRGGSVCDVF